MEYREYIKECQRRQRAYIRDEQRKIAKAEKLYAQYWRGMISLNLHPLDRNEIVDRKRQLERMAATVKETHGDSQAMRFAFEMHFAREQASVA